MERYTQRKFAELVNANRRWLQLRRADGSCMPYEDENGKIYYTDEHVAIIEKIRSASPQLKKHVKDSETISETATGETATADSTLAISDDTATSAQEALQASIDAVDDQTPADVQNTAKIDDNASCDTREEIAEMSPTLVDEIPAVVTIDVEAEFVTLDKRAERIRKLAADVTRGIIEIGRELIAAKAEIGHGNWTQWLKTEFDWTARTAQNFMAVAERFGKNENVFVFKPSTLIQMLALPVGTEQEFIDQQAEADKPVEEMLAREVKSSVAEFNRQHSDRLKENFGTVPPETNSPAETDNDASQKKTLPPISRNKNGSVEYFTPKEIVDAARRVFGGSIDLDPASCALANETVKAEKFFSKDDDGLSQMWHGNIWLNPPYANGVIQKFVSKLLASDFTAAIVLVDAATDTKWFGALADACAGIVFTTGRVNCLPHGEKKSSNPTRGSAIFYFGDDAGNFFAEFEQFGFGVYPRKKNTPQ